MNGWILAMCLRLYYRVKYMCEVYVWLSRLSVVSIAARVTG